MTAEDILERHRAGRAALKAGNPQAARAWNYRRPSSALPLRRDPARVNVAFASSWSGNVGGTDMWHRVLLPRLDRHRVNVLGYGVAGPTGRQAELMEAEGIAVFRGRDEQLRLVRAADVVVAWGDPKLSRFEEAGDPPLAFVIHEDIHTKAGQSVRIATHAMEYGPPTVFVGVSKAARLCVAEGPHRENTRVIYNGAPPMPPRRPDPAPTLLFLGRFDHIKRPLHPIHILASLPAEWRLIMAGDGQMRGEMEALAADLGLTDRVEFTGVVEPGPVLARAWVSVMPSEAEAFAFVSVETWRAGVPLVATRVGAIREFPDLARIVDHEATFGEWAEAIVESAADPSRGDRARAVAEGVLSAERMAEQWSNLIVELAEGRGWKPPPPGPGTILKGWLGLAGIKATAGCGCADLAARMDAEGADWCTAHIDEIVQAMGAEAERRGLPRSDWGARLLVRRAIAKAKGAANERRHRASD
jgi:glycosyltransferase involved in cell wall biosynthesis